ncbi:MerR family transcriptional regulator [Natronoglycomyces albus]|uniref:MerR family transcriptional regulator n=1 Tax=Natronoglycomyces albus TaxID=2811108 RepID=A0A895XHU7_9ACTN|nr:MerR family transcriptional regulator [Natronoglycomyces albus]QSB04517.1 MerR family transcriptional regulator [Natronoglycomyces albus]
MAQASRPDEKPQLRIGELAKRTGATPRMLRHYENEGLIEAQRSSTGQRLFSSSAVEQVHHIRRLLAVGLPLAVIGELFGCIRDPQRLEPCAVPLLAEHLHAYDSRIAQLSSTRDALQGLIDASTSDPLETSS